MTKNPPYAEKFDYAIRMLETIGEHPILAEQLVKTIEFKDFTTQLQLYKQLTKKLDNQ